MSKYKVSMTTDVDLAGNTLCRSILFKQGDVGVYLRQSSLYLCKQIGQVISVSLANPVDFRHTDQLIALLETVRRFAEKNQKHWTRKIARFKKEYLDPSARRCRNCAVSGDSGIRLFIPLEGFLCSRKSRHKLVLVKGKDEGCEKWEQKGVDE